MMQTMPATFIIGIGGCLKVVALILTLGIISIFCALASPKSGGAEARKHAGGSHAFAEATAGRHFWALIFLVLFVPACV